LGLDNKLLKGRQGGEGGSWNKVQKNSNKSSKKVRKEFEKSSKKG
jgi:hypothetical protein